MERSVETQCRRPETEGERFRLSLCGAGSAGWSRPSDGGSNHGELEMELANCCCLLAMFRRCCTTDQVVKISILHRMGWTSTTPPTSALAVVQRCCTSLRTAHALDFPMPKADPGRTLACSPPPSPPLPCRAAQAQRPKEGDHAAALRDSALHSRALLHIPPPPSLRLPNITTVRFCRPSTRPSSSPAFRCRVLFPATMSC
ncbi:hypothetical protein B0T24DRAFT_140328 [Lasiosphaeria ovina]|uniref:Uncharacterized protein n=1 Tax=Lasiosphaeria ovina TaxID=92902 RepID=A0AAE0KL96_9PEZI|nr:hypothetical protein B0T24DRAFT_140328 [Lasiosphaeria ovina]